MSDFEKWFQETELAKLDLSYAEKAMIELGWDFGYQKASENIKKVIREAKSYDDECNERESKIDRRFES